MLFSKDWKHLVYITNASSEGLQINFVGSSLRIWSEPECHVWCGHHTIWQCPIMSEAELNETKLCTHQKEYDISRGCESYISWKLRRCQSVHTSCYVHIWFVHCKLCVVTSSLKQRHQFDNCSVAFELVILQPLDSHISLNDISLKDQSIKDIYLKGIFLKIYFL